MLDALKEEAWLVPAVLGMAVALKQLSVEADAEQARKGQGANQVRMGCVTHDVWGHGRWNGGCGNSSDGCRCG